MLQISDIPEENILFYDIETDGKFAPYCDLKMLGAQIGFHGKPYLVELKKERDDFKARLKDPDVLKVAFNQWSFDNIVLDRFGYPVVEEGSHDVFLMFKTIAPQLPAHSMKFVTWYYTGDPHFPEMELMRWCRVNKMDMWDAPKYLLKPYCLHDIVQTRILFEIAWEVIQRPAHWNAYTLDNEAGPAIKEMMIDGGMFLNRNRIEEEIATLQVKKLAWEGRAWDLSKGEVTNPNSNQQLGKYLADEGFELDLTASGEFAVPKTVLLDLLDLENESNDMNPVARCAYEVRQINSILKYFNNYKSALYDNADSLSRGWIPRQYSLSGAKTRRTLSNSKYKLNFQNATEECKKVQPVPDGWLGGWIDSTQVENVVHIYESDDFRRRAAYEADEEWNEYVWLCNEILGGSRTKKELDGIPSPQFPGWSIYKQFKTVKLSLNFGLGLAEFCKRSGIDFRTGEKAFELVHQACPAIRGLQDRVGDDVRKHGFVQDVFGHIYAGGPAYKVVAYLIQGTGTGSLPKAQLGANRRVLRELGSTDIATLCGTTHDESEFRLNLRLLSPEKIFATLQKLMYNMTDRFSDKFDGIPLRAKLYLSRKDAYDAHINGEVSINDRDKIMEMICQNI